MEESPLLMPSGDQLSEHRSGGEGAGEGENSGSDHQDSHSGSLASGFSSGGTTGGGLSGGFGEGEAISTTSIRPPITTSPNRWLNIAMPKIASSQPINRGQHSNLNFESEILPRQPWSPSHEIILSTSD